MGNANSILIYDSVCSLEYSLQPNPKFIITSNINTFLEEVVAIENDILSFRYHLDFYIRRNRSFFAIWGTRGILGTNSLEQPSSVFAVPGEACG